MTSAGPCLAGPIHFWRQKNESVPFCAPGALICPILCPGCPILRPGLALKNESVPFCAPGALICPILRPGAPMFAHRFRFSNLTLGLRAQSQIREPGKRWPTSPARGAEWDRTGAPGDNNRTKKNQMWNRGQHRGGGGNKTKQNETKQNITQQNGLGLGI